MIINPFVLIAGCCRGHYIEAVEALLYRSDLGPSTGPIPGQGEIQPEWQDLSHASPTYQMSQFYGDNEDFTSSNEDTKNLSLDEKSAVDTDLAISNIEPGQLNLKKVNNFEITVISFK